MIMCTMYVVVTKFLAQIAANKFVFLVQVMTVSGRYSQKQTKEVVAMQITVAKLYENFYLKK